MSSLGSTRRGGRSRADLPLNAEINVTSLVDVAFTLLVIFIITAPILQGGIEVSIPRADVRPLTSQERPFFVTIERSGQIFMEETAVTLAELESGLPQLLAGGSVERIFIRADSMAPYGPVLKTMAIAVNSGINWSVVAEPYVPRR
ncbi:MAG: biopolymer transporter ExbD [Gemmatimonadetes bacterium]|nr:biopolymer transporter ExbD [Gemmatimonadota bacterium]MDA1104605.1 biopolymer transporter ExbD [Gemmatimonadota bacterium]